MEAWHTTAAALDIEFGPHCWGCDTPHAIAREMQTLGLPGVDSQIIAFSNPATVRPASIFAVPTYLLNGRASNLGNPKVD